jgi:hypothetical protein
MILYSQNIPSEWMDGYMDRRMEMDEWIMDGQKKHSFPLSFSSHINYLSWLPIY